MVKKFVALKFNRKYQNSLILVSGIGLREMNCNGELKNKEKHHPK